MQVAGDVEVDENDDMAVDGPVFDLIEDEFGEVDDQTGLGDESSPDIELAGGDGSAEDAAIRRHVIFSGPDAYHRLLRDTVPGGANEEMAEGELPADHLYGVVGDAQGPGSSESDPSEEFAEMERLREIVRRSASPDRAEGGSSSALQQVDEVQGGEAQLPPPRRLRPDFEQRDGAVGDSGRDMTMTTQITGDGPSFDAAEDAGIGDAAEHDDHEEDEDQRPVGDGAADGRPGGSRKRRLSQ